MQNDVSDEPAPQKCHICEAPMVLVSNPGGDGHLSDAAHLQMHGLQVRHGGDGQDALVPIDSFGDYAVARNAVIASKLGERAKACLSPLGQRWQNLLLGHSRWGSCAAGRIGAHEGLGFSRACEPIPLSQRLHLLCAASALHRV